MRILAKVILRNIKLREKNKELRSLVNLLEKARSKQYSHFCREISVLEKELDKINDIHDREMIALEKEYEKKYNVPKSRIDTLAEDNRRLIASIRRKESEEHE